MEDYICMDCETRYTVDINADIVDIHCPECGSEDVMPLDEYLASEETDEDYDDLYGDEGESYDEDDDEDE